jgi:hypothetical protein
MLAAMDAEGTRTHEQNVRLLDEVCAAAVAKIPAMTAEMRKLSIGMLPH